MFFTLYLEAHFVLRRDYPDCVFADRFRLLEAKRGRLIGKSGDLISVDNAGLKQQ